MFILPLSLILYTISSRSHKMKTTHRYQIFLKTLFTITRQLYLEQIYDSSLTSYFVHLIGQRQ